MNKCIYCYQIAQPCQEVTIHVGDKIIINAFLCFGCAMERRDRTTIENNIIDQVDDNEFEFIE